MDMCQETQEERRAKAQQAKENLRKIFKENPELAKAYRETIAEMRTPENIEATAKDICKMMNVVNQMKKQLSQD